MTRAEGKIVFVVTVNFFSGRADNNGKMAGVATSTELDIPILAVDDVAARKRAVENAEESIRSYNRKEFGNDGYFRIRYCTMTAQEISSFVKSEDEE